MDAASRTSYRSAARVASVTCSCLPKRTLPARERWMSDGHSSARSCAASSKVSSVSTAATWACVFVTVDTTCDSSMRASVCCSKMPAAFSWTCSSQSGNDACSHRCCGNATSPCPSSSTSASMPTVLLKSSAVAWIAPAESALPLATMPMNAATPATIIPTCQ